MDTRDGLLKALDGFKQTSRYKIMSEVCPAVSLEQAFMAGWLWRNDQDTKKKAKKKARP